jgi:hypothetical protein
MQLLLCLVISAIIAIPIDWAIQYQVKLTWSATTTGKEPTPYQFGPPKKILAIIGYILPADILIAYRQREGADLWVILALGFLILYVSYTSYLTIQSMNDRSADVE